jgi:tetratricopeptide (TPR) repeat protein
MGRPNEAKKEIKTALELDPVSLVIKKDSANPYFYSRQYDKAIEILLNAIEIDPTFPGLHLYLGWQYFCKSMYKKALDAFEVESKIRKDWQGSPQAMIGITYANMGMKEEALQVLDELIENSKYEYAPILLLTKLCYDLGEGTLYKNLLDKAFRERDPIIAMIKEHPLYDNLRSDKAFIAFLKKVNLLDE